MQPHVVASTSLARLLLRRYGMLVGSALLLGFGLTSKPDTSFVRWAQKEAAKELKEEGVL